MDKTNQEENKANLLIVDDAPTNIRALSVFLAEDYNIFVATKGIDALDILKAQKVELILLDVVMPEMDGYEVCKILKSADTTKNIPVVFITSMSDEEDEERGLSLGASDYITKPFKEAIVRTRIKNHLERHRMEEALRKEVEYRKRAQEKIIQTEKMASLGQLVAGLAHEINTPIGIGVTAASHLVKISEDIQRHFEKETLTKNSLDTYLKDAKDISGLVLQHLKRTSDLIKSFKMVAVDQTEEQKRRFLVKEYLEDIVVSLKPKLKNTLLKVVIACKKDLEIETYPGTIAQIFTNLIINSLMHAYDEGQGGTIKITSKQQEKNIVFIYRDDGKGIPEENLKSIFEPFFTTKRNKGGTGLGLHIIYNLVHASLKGSIVCESEEGKGTAFIINVPID